MVGLGGSTLRKSLMFVLKVSVDRFECESPECEDISARDVVSSYSDEPEWVSLELVGKIVAGLLMDK